MGKNDSMNFKYLSSLYLKLKEKRLNALDEKNEKLKQQIKAENNLLLQNIQYTKQLTEENNSIKTKYQNIEKLFKNANKTISIKNNNYNISPWENVFIVKKASHFVIQSKKQQDIHIFSDDMNDFIEYLLTLNHSIIVLSVDEKRIVLQLNLKELTNFNPL